jgi:hypothetical protein
MYEFDSDEYASAFYKRGISEDSDLVTEICAVAKKRENDAYKNGHEDASTDGEWIDDLK